jgi:nucleolar protein 56
MDNISSYSLQDRRKPEFHAKLRDMNIRHAKELISKTVNEDTYIMQSINSIEELDKVCNVLSKRLREWYGYYFPELSQHIVDNDVFVKRILQKSKKEFMEEYSVDISMGPDILQKDIDAILGLARQIGGMYSERENIILYLENMMKDYAPNINTLCGTLIAAKLLEKAGSLKHLSILPSSTIQLLGAEQALFRHLRNKKIRPPKHGLILSHPFVMDAKRSDRGKMARMLAAKISIAAKVDYFKGEFIGDKLRAELEKK